MEDLRITDHQRPPRDSRRASSVLSVPSLSRFGPPPGAGCMLRVEFELGVPRLFCSTTAFRSGGSVCEIVAAGRSSDLRGRL